MSTPTRTHDHNPADWRLQRGFYVTVYRDALLPEFHSGLSLRSPWLTVIGVASMYQGQFQFALPVPVDAQLHQPSKEIPPVWIVKTLAGAHIAPATITAEGNAVPSGDWLFGGNFAYCADQHFADLVGHDAAVKIHDRPA